MIWVQVGDERVTAVPPSGKADVYADFVFSQRPIPEGAQVKFLIGKGKLPDKIVTSGASQEVKALTEAEIIEAIVPVDGVELLESVGVVENHLVKNANNEFVVAPVAKVSFVISKPITEDGLTVVAYSTYDKIGTVKRLQAQETELTVSSGEGVFLSSGEKYDPGLNDWTDVAPMPTGRAGLCCTAVGSKIYAMGGFNFDFTSANEEYDTALDSWEAKAPMLVARGFSASVEYGGEVYVIGGFGFQPGRGMTTFDKYDPVTDSWTALPPIPAAIAFGVANVISDKIYVMFGGSTFTGKDDAAGETISEFSNGVYVYDLLGGTWSAEDVLRGGSVPAAETANLTAAAAAGAFVISVPPASTFPPYGVVSIEEGASKDVVRYVRFNAALGTIELSKALANSYTTAAVVREASLPQNRISPNSHVDGTKIRIYNGKSFLGFTSAAPSSIISTVVEYDTATGVFDEVSNSPTIPRYRAGGGILLGNAYVAAGSGDKSVWLDEAEYAPEAGGAFVGKPTVAEMSLPRHSVGAAAAAGFLYVMGGAGSGHEAGWLKIEVHADPELVKADGKQTASIVITATDASGDPPPDGTKFRVSGIIYLKLTEEEQEQQQAENAAAEGEGTAVQSATGAATTTPAPQKISILPVLFSALELTMVSGTAATTMLARSEDPVTEIEQLFNFVKNGEEVIDQQGLKKKFDEQARRNITTTVGTRRELYSAAVEVTVDDPFFFGTSSTDAAIAESNSEPLTDAAGFKFNPPSAKQGLSASVAFYSDISSIPDVEVVTEEVDDVDAKAALATMSEEIPFGSSPHFDAIATGAKARNVGSSARNIMISVSDNDQNSSSNSAQDAADEANAVAGFQKFPVFVNTFVVTDPISLSARKARTDVADLELISSDTGGNSFSVVDASYVGFVIDRIKTSAPSSIGSGTITAVREINGSLSSIEYVVSNLGPSGNEAEMTVWLSLDGYNYDRLEGTIPPNVTYSLGTPLKTAYVKYEVRLSSKTFDSPVLESVGLSYVEPNVQYIFAYPQAVAGQVSELAAVVNHRLPSGGTVEVGLTHGESLMFDRDFRSKAQPATGERGTIVAINRNDGGTFIGDQPTRDRLETSDFIVYRSKTGPWAQDAVASVFVNETLALPTDYLAMPEQALVAFKRKLSPTDVVGLEVQNSQAAFRVGIKVTNPSLEAGFVDSFAYMYGSTEDAGGGRLNRAPRAVNLFITPSPVLPAGPITANYTFVDPDGDDEDATQTEINWFRNGVVVPGLRNKKSITNSDIVASRSDSKGLIAKGQEWFFSVRPSDGRAFGPVAISHTITVVNVPPRASEIKITSSNKNPDLFTSSDTLTADFTFADSDADKGSGTIYSWFAGGNEVKSGDSSTLGPDENDANGNKILAPGATITVQVTPSDGTDFGETVTSNPITITGTPPSVTDVSLLPTAPTSASNLRITYKFVDKDKLTDQSRIAWFKNDSRMSDMDDAKTIPSSQIAPGQKWQAVVTPSNGTADGTAVTSNAVLIKF